MQKAVERWKRKRFVNSTEVSRAVEKKFNSAEISREVEKRNIFQQCRNQLRGRKDKYFSTVQKSVKRRFFYLTVQKSGGKERKSKRSRATRNNIEHQ